MPFESHSRTAAEQASTAFSGATRTVLPNIGTPLSSLDVRYSSASCRSTVGAFAPSGERAHATGNAIQMELLDSGKNLVTWPGVVALHHIQRVLGDTLGLVRVACESGEPVHCESSWWAVPTLRTGATVRIILGCYGLRSMFATMTRIIAAICEGSTAVDNAETVFPPMTTELQAALADLQIAASPEQVELLDHYRRLLWSWNERMNLTRHTTLEKFVGRDVVDSHELSKLLKKGERVLDVGTGGGVPGIVLTILRPDLSVSLCESTHKKAKAIEAIVDELGLPARVFPSRAEEVLEITTFGTLVARALAPLAKVLTWLRPHWDAFDQLLMIKGPAWVEEREVARQAGLMRNLELRKAAAYLAPVTGAQSVILSIRQKQ